MTGGNSLVHVPGNIEVSIEERISVCASVCASVSIGDWQAKRSIMLCDNVILFCVEYFAVLSMMDFSTKATINTRMWLLCLLLIPLCLHNINWLDMIVRELDHCPVLMCDFEKHYLPQAQRLHNGVLEVVPGWFYPPLLVTLLIPFEMVGISFGAWAAINVLTLLVLIGFTAKESKIHWFWCSILTIFSLSVLHSLKWGQVSLLINLLIVLSFRYHNVFLALASALKVYPLAFKRIK